MDSPAPPAAWTAVSGEQKRSAEQRLLISVLSLALLDVRDADATLRADALAFLTSEAARGLCAAIDLDYRQVERFVAQPQGLRRGQRKLPSRWAK